MESRASSFPRPPEADPPLAEKRESSQWIILFLLTAITAYAGPEKRYSVEFQDADIRGVLRIIAKMDNKNIVVPEKMESKVTASFDEVTLSEAMAAILKTNGFGMILENNIIQVVPKQDLTALGEDLFGTSFELKFAKAETVLAHAQTLVSERGSVIADARTNSIHVRDTKAALNNIQNLIAKIDRMDQQVLIEAKIVEATSDFARTLGIRWGITRSGAKVQVRGLTAVGTDDAGRALILNAPHGGSGGPPLSGLGLIIGGVSGGLADIDLFAAEQKGDVSILSRPSIATINNQAATIRSGAKFFVKLSGGLNIGTQTSPTGTATSGLQQIETGIELKVTPQISLRDYVKLDIEATASEADFSRAVDGIPAIIDNTALTTVMLKDGEMAVIGGLFSLRDAKTIRGMPGMMKVPLLGNLFQGKSKSKTKTELLIFITPTIVRNEMLKALPTPK